MPIHEDSVIQAIGEERAERYTPGEWIQGSKDVLVTGDGGRLTALGDQIVVKAGAGGMVASPGDIVVWCGLLVLAAEASVAWQRRERRHHIAEHTHAAAEGGAAT
ncbi:MAG: hypothetical protein HY873_03115 [Chloroflexi bacterium]|nr:hypothetical protein [Chloroflexota bacterium]